MGLFGDMVRAAFALNFVTGRENTAANARDAGAAVAEAVDHLEGLQRGAKNLSGAVSPPSSAIGLDGDSYTNTVTSDYYLKDANGWQFQFRLKGGDGHSPVKGIDYTDGYTPRKGTDYRDGIDGKSAYKLWLDQGNVGPVQDFLKSLHGADGLAYEPLHTSEVIADSAGIADLPLRDAMRWLANNRTAGTVPAVPTITSFTPTSGLVGSSVVITGTNFTGATVVSINSGTVASFVVNSATQITAVLSSSQATGLVRVTTPGGTATSASAFTVTVATGTLTVDNNANLFYYTPTTGTALDSGFEKLP